MNYECNKPIFNTKHGISKIINEQNLYDDLDVFTIVRALRDRRIDVSISLTNFVYYTKLSTLKNVKKCLQMSFKTSVHLGKLII